MEIFPQREEFSCSGGQKNDTAACLLPCSTHPAKRPGSLILTVLSNPQLFHLPCAPVLPASGTHRSLPKSHSSHLLLHSDGGSAEQANYLHLWWECMPAFAGMSRKRPNLDVINHSFDVFSTSRSLVFSLTIFLILFVICKFCTQLQGGTNRSVVKIGRCALKENCQYFEVWN